ncbi:MAG TPA: (d)CMP kinase [Actinomycetota bacterium]|nr:(d)CMP kinase [Actinomycetota bacterium]
MIVAIDGPAGAGKSTVASAVAAKLGFEHLDTGALYRVITLLGLEEGVGLDAGEDLAALAAAADIRLDGGRVIVGNQDLTEPIRSAEVTAAVSQVAAHPQVRTALIPLQRAVAARDVVVEGRDIGTEVFPDAEVKIFLTASPRARAERRARELRLEPAVDRLESEMVARDKADSTRSVSPLTRAHDAIEVDTSDMSFDDVVDRVVAVVEAARSR